MIIIPYIYLVISSLHNFWRFRITMAIHCGMFVSGTSLKALSVLCWFHSYNSSVRESAVFTFSKWETEPLEIKQSNWNHVTRKKLELRPMWPQSRWPEPVLYCLFWCHNKCILTFTHNDHCSLLWSKVAHTVIIWKIIYLHKRKVMEKAVAWPKSFVLFCFVICLIILHVFYSLNSITLACSLSRNLPKIGDSF